MNIFGSISWVDFLTSLFILLTIYNVIVFIYFLANKTADNQSILPENKYSESENEQLSFIDNSEDSFEEETTIINADEPYNANIETEDDYKYTEVDNPPLPITPEEQNIFEEYSNARASAESARNKHLYESGFKDGVKVLKELMSW